MTDGAANESPSRPPDLLRRPPRLRVCGICRKAFGPALKATKDHVLPRGFFSAPVPRDLPTWLVCGLCQDLLDPAEERLRNLFVRGPSHNPEVHQEAFERAQCSERKVVPEKVDWVVNSEDQPELASIARAEQEDLDLVFSKMVAGLFYWKHHRLLPEVPLVVRGALSRDDSTVWTNLVQTELKLSVQHLGSVSWVAESDTELQSGFWLFALHGALLAGVWAGELAQRTDLPRSCPFPVRL